MPFTGKILADGQLSDSWAVIYEVQPNLTGFVKHFNVFNTNGSAEPVEVRINSGNASPSEARMWRNAEIDAEDWFNFLADGDTLQLGPGATIEAKTTTADVCDYVITGVEQS